MEWLRWILLAVGAILIGAIYVAGRRQQRPDRENAAAEGASGTAPGGRSGSTPTRQAPTFGEGPARAVDEAHEFGPEAADPWSVEDFRIDTVAVEDAVELDDPSAETVEPDLAEPAAEAPSEPPDPPATETPQPDPELQARRPEGSEPRRARSAPAVEPAPERLVVLYVVAAEGRRLVGAQLAQAFARHGLEHGELGAFHARARDGTPDRNGRAATEFSVANVLEPGAFDPATMDTLSTPGVVLILRVPGPPAPLAAFERMVVTARDLARELDGRVLDEKRTPLTRQSEQLLRDELRRLATTPEHSR